MTERLITEAATYLLNSSYSIALTGAGVSTKSGIPDFRGPSGLWTKIDPSKFATFNAFLSDPKAWWENALEMAPIFQKAKPNPAHKMLAKLEQLGLLRCLVTQNVDGLHQQAGSQNVLEVHGSIFSASCIVCNSQVKRQYIERAIKKRRVPAVCPSCGGLLKLDAVFFGEQLPRQPFALAVQAAQNCQTLLAVGTSLLVYPIASLPGIAKQNGANLVIINDEPTPFDKEADVVVHAEVGDTLTQIVAMIKKIKR